MGFEKLGLNHNLLKSIKELGFKEPTIIQQRAIPVVLEKRDLFATALTGTGKTAAFGLPILHRLKKHQPDSHRALILAPTKELALQISDDLKLYAKYTDLKVVMVVGGKELISQKRELKRGADIIVATPSKLLEHIQNGLDLKSVEFFVLDEADRMLDMGFVKDIRKLHEYLTKKHQTLLFSATISDKIRKLSKLLLRRPVFIETAKKNTTVENVRQYAYKIDEEKKGEATAYLIGSKNYDQVLVFTRTKKSADELVKILKEYGLKSEVIHGDIQRSTRLRRIKEFKAKKFQVLVATDIASRGLDIAKLPCVINYELPAAPSDYIHRVGRTGRAGREGEAISLLDIYERYDIRQIEQIIDEKIEQDILEGFEPDPTRKREDRESIKLKSEYSNQYQKKRPKKRSTPKTKKRKTTKRDR
ncbi:ATP-dependent RNA helicase RhlE [hydrothermal vent metagenome]|uniref:ATP-dependent RNA helicase RhlE n=1 Tax=hydrothermal vent metagenome TaxID=652676 RepID=A0A1W1BUW9_9ZZZZ